MARPKTLSPGKRLEAIKPRGRKPALAIVPDTTLTNPVVDQEPLFRTRANIDHLDFGMAVNRAGEFDYLRGSAIDEITSSRGLTGPAHDDKIRRAIRYLRATLSDPESVTLVCTIIAYPLGLGFWLGAMLKCGGLI